MTREEIKNTPKIVDYVVSESLVAESKEKLHKRLDEICNLAIKALDQEPCEDCISRHAAFEQVNCWIGSGEYRYTNATDYLTKRIKDISSVTPTEPKIDVLDKIRAEIKKDVAHTP